MKRQPVDLDEIAAQVDRLAALVGAGATQPAAWSYLAAASGGATAELAARVATEAASGRPLAPAFAGAEQPWRRVGAVVGLAARTGAPLAPALVGAARSVRAGSALRRAVEASVAGPAASARLVLLLPPGSALLGWAFGFDVPRVLFGTWAGAGLLAVGASLLVAATVWSRRLIRAAGRTSPTVALHLELVATAVRAGLPVPRAQLLAEEAATEAGLGGVDGGEADGVIRFAAEAGLPVATLLEAEADRLHRAAQAEAGVRATVLSVRLLVPLGALVLPAFLLLGAVPIGMAVLAGTTAPL